MAVATLKSLHKYLTVLESASEMKRKMPASSHQRSLKDGLSEIGKLVGIDNFAFKDPQNIAAVIGPQRFIMIWGEPSVTAHVGRIFDSSRVLFTVLIESGQLEKATAGSNSSLAHQQAAANSLSAGWIE